MIPRNLPYWNTCDHMFLRPIGLQHLNFTSVIEHSSVKSFLIPYNLRLVETSNKKFISRQSLNCIPRIFFLLLFEEKNKIWCWYYELMFLSLKKKKNINWCFCLNLSKIIYVWFKIPNVIIYIRSIQGRLIINNSAVLTRWKFNACPWNFGNSNHKSIKYIGKFNKLYDFFNKLIWNLIIINLL